MLPWSLQMAWRQRLQNKNISFNPVEISKTKNMLTDYWSLYPLEMVLVLWKALSRVFANISPFFFLLQSCLRLFFVYGIAKRDLGISLLYFGSNTNSCTFYSIRIGMCVSKENYWTLLSNNIGAWFTFKVLFSLMCSIALTPIFNEIFQHST